METKRWLKKVGGSVALFIPSEIHFAVSIARGTTGAEDIARWFEDHARKR